MRSICRPTREIGRLLYLVVLVPLAGCGDGTAVLPSPASDEPPPDPDPPPVVEDIAAARRHACALMSDGTARCWGDNDSFQLGHLCEAGTNPWNCGVASRVWDDAEDVFVDGVPYHQATDPPPREPFDGLVDLSLSIGTSCAVRQDRTMWCWGDNFYGDFRTGERSGASLPVQGQLEGIEDLVVGCAILEDESLWRWGWKTVDGPPSSAPTRVESVDRAVALARTSGLCVLLPKGRVACAGSNQWGEVGDGTFEERAFTGEHRAYTPVVHLDDAVQVSRSSTYVCALRRGGRVSCWGSGDGLGNGINEDSAVPLNVPLPHPATFIHAGSRHACAILNDGSLWCWGDNAWGQLGTGEAAPCPCWSYGCLPCDEHDGHIPRKVKGLDGEVIDVATGGDFTCALMKHDHSVWCWGANRTLQLGSGYEDGRIPIAGPAPAPCPGASSSTTTSTIPGGSRKSPTFDVAVPMDPRREAPTLVRTALERVASTRGRVPRSC